MAKECLSLSVSLLMHATLIASSNYLMLIKEIEEELKVEKLSNFSDLNWEGQTWDFVQIEEVLLMIIL